jgi:hypothetical protein
MIVGIDFQRSKQGGRRGLIMYKSSEESGKKMAVEEPAHHHGIPLCIIVVS